MNNALELVEELSKLIKDAIYDMERLSRENDLLIAENKSLTDDNKRLQSLVTSQRTEIDTLKEELVLWTTGCLYMR